MARKWQILLIVSLGAFMSSLDVFIVNIAFPAMQRDFPGSSLSALSWVLNGYAIVFAAFLVPAGRLADRVGHRRIFLLGLGVFTVGSALCGIATGPSVLVSARAVQAVGAALLTPTSLALILPAFPASQRALAVGIWAAIGAIAASLGPTVGGMLVQSSWRWVFLVNIPVALVCAIGTLRLVDESRHPEPGPRPDLVGAVLLALGIAALTLGIVEGPAWGWANPTMLAVIVALVLLIGGFVVRSARHPSPVVDLAMLRVPTFVLACLGTLLSAAVLATSLLGRILFVTTQWDYSSVRAGLSITPGPVFAGICAILGGRLASRVPLRRLALLGTLAFGLGSVSLVVFMGPDPDYLRAMLPGMVLTGIGVGLTLSPLTSMAAAALPVQRAATGLAVVTMSRQIGTALGIAVLIAILGTPTAETSNSIFRDGWLFMLALSVLNGIVVLGLRPVPTTQRGTVDDDTHSSAILRPDESIPTVARI